LSSCFSVMIGKSVISYINSRGHESVCADCSPFFGMTEYLSLNTLFSKYRYLGENMEEVIWEEYWIE
jgi:hypothetical protein